MKIISTESEVRKSILEGVDVVCDVVRSTIGPGGTNVLIGGGKGNVPIITNDGVTAADSVNELEDEVANEVAGYVRQEAKKTNEILGDASSTFCTLLQAVTHTLLDPLVDDVKDSLVKTSGKKINVMQVNRDVTTAFQEVQGELMKLARPITTLQEVVDVATVSMEDADIGEKIANLLYKVGKDAYVSVEDGTTTEVETDIIQGIKLSTGFASDAFINAPKGQALMITPHILVTNQHITNVGQVQNICGKLASEGQKNLVIIAPEFTSVMLATFLSNCKRGVFNVLPVKAPYIRQPEILADIAIMTGGTVIEESVKKLDDVEVKDLGKCERVISKANETAILKGEGTQIHIKTLELEESIKNEKSEWEKKKIKERIGRINGVMGVIRVGAVTEGKRKYTKDKIDDAVNSTRNAIEEGIVVGGGKALKTVAELLPNNMLAKAIVAPYNNIQENAGGNLEIGVEIVDALKNIRIALQRACESAALLATVGTAVVKKVEQPCCHKSQLSNGTEEN